MAMFKKFAGIFASLEGVQFCLVSEYMEAFYTIAYKCLFFSRLVMIFISFIKRQHLKFQGTDLILFASNLV